MVMVRRGSQEWRPAGGQSIAQPRPFERTDGTVMSHEEIKRVSMPIQSDVAGKSNAARARQTSSVGGKQPTRKQAEAWEAMQRLGYVADVARELGVTPKAIDDRLAGYASRTGVAVPAKRPRSTRREQHEDVRGRTTPEVEVQDLPPAPTLAQAFEAAAETARSDAADRAAADHPSVTLVVHEGGESHARSYEEGFQEALQQYMPERAIEALFDWLTLHGKDWSQAQAERWFKALTATIDLIYPTTDDAREAAA